MSSITVSNSRAVQLAIEIEENLTNHKERIKCYKSKISEIQQERKTYDEENNQYDMRERYPDLELLKNRYQEKTALLKSYSKEQRELVNIYKELNQKLIELESACLDPQIIEKLKFIHETAGREIEFYHADLNLRMKKLGLKICKIGKIIDKGFIEIDWIVNHPHLRLRQTIERVSAGQLAPGYMSPLYDRIARNIPSIPSVSSFFNFQRDSFEFDDDSAPLVENQHRDPKEEEDLQTD